MMDLQQIRQTPNTTALSPRKWEHAFGPHPNQSAKGEGDSWSSVRGAESAVAPQEIIQGVHTLVLFAIQRWLNFQS